ncbi:CotH kinase family protein [Coprobacter tertius]|uniref:CotH kinase family protein n=1 Tax=Coprobacter tertius TaxID=2944915 RepID=A0ABT1MD59_9BACT|nr:CotH kinase family protein [Coprobacter tertius]MCP9610578.1 CotH kinase family protein [Coprobacter tertius]
MKLRYFIILFLGCSSYMSAQVSQKLTGNIIGTEFSVDYDHGVQSTTVNTKENVFDGDFDTFFASFDRSGTWVGLDLGEPHIITKIGYSPRVGSNNRVVLAVIEGANSPDFIDAIPIYLIKEEAPDRKMTYAEIDCSRGFRYVRYVSPNDVRCNLAELEFYGKKGEGDDSKLYQPTNLPLVTIHTEGAKDIVEKEVYLPGQVSIISEDGTKLLHKELDVRGRGNASWSFPKKPYRMKFNKKDNVLDFPAKAKNWTLISNYGDHTLMRNLIAFEISRRVGLEYTPAGRPVDVMLNGEYKGCYQLCDQVEVNENRVNVEEMEPTDISSPNIEGGYLIEVDAYAYSEISWFASAQKQIPVTIKYPKDDEIVSQQRQYIVNRFNEIESRLFSNDFITPGKSYRELFDVKSFLQHFLVGELTGNTDTYWSTFMYKRRNDPLLYTGPVWDFDIAFENDDRTYPINAQTDFLYRFERASHANNMNVFADRVLLSDPQTKEELSALWTKCRKETGITAESLLDYIDKTASELQEAQKLNFKRWPINDTFEDALNVVKTYLSERVAWMDKKIPFTTGIKNVSVVSEGIIYADNMQVVVTNFEKGAVVNIYDLQGQLVTQGVCDENGVRIPLTAGFYVVQVVSHGKSISQKKVLL